MNSEEARELNGLVKVWRTCLDSRDTSADDPFARALKVCTEQLSETVARFEIVDNDD